MLSIVMTLKNRLMYMCCIPTEDITFRHDLLPCNNSKSTIIFIEYKQRPVLKWPGYSPDMNHIEGVWNIMKKGLVI